MHKIIEKTLIGDTLFLAGFFTLFYLHHTKKMIQTYILHPQLRTDIRQRVLSQFKNKTEFNIHIVEYTQEPGKAFGLWQSILNIINNITSKEDEYIVLCGEDHQFTRSYSSSSLFSCIELAQKNDVDLISGGPGLVTTILPVSESLYWMENFTELRFTIIFRKFFSTILAAEFGENDSVDAVLSFLTQNKFFMHPFISSRYNAESADTLLLDTADADAKDAYINCAQNIETINKVYRFYCNRTLTDIDINALSGVTIPTYIINDPERIGRKTHMISQFHGRPEFDVTMIDACQHPLKKIGLWHSIRKAVRMAIENDDDVIIICGDDHEFSSGYTKEFLLKNILEANNQGADYMSCGCSQFGYALPISANRIWTSYVLSIQFIVVYKRFFNKVLDEFFDDDITPDVLLSTMTSNKMLLYPFISIQKDSGGSDHYSGSSKRNFTNTNERLHNIQHAYMRYLNGYLI